MYTLSYDSITVNPLSAKEMELLLNESRIYNEENSITGCLIAYSDRFIQLLEGEKEIIHKVFEKIRADRRHTNVQLFSENYIGSRTFPGWGMAYYPIDDNEMNKTEFEQFKRNLMLLADLSSTTNATALTFWKRMKFMVTNPPKEI